MEPAKFHFSLKDPLPGNGKVRIDTRGAWRLKLDRGEGRPPLWKDLENDSHRNPGISTTPYTTERVIEILNDELEAGTNRRLVDGLRIVDTEKGITYADLDGNGLRPLNEQVQALIEMTEAQNPEEEKKPQASEVLSPIFSSGNPSFEPTWTGSSIEALPSPRPVLSGTVHNLIKVLVIPYGIEGRASPFPIPTEPFWRPEDYRIPFLLPKDGRGEERAIEMISHLFMRGDEHLLLGCYSGLRGRGINLPDDDYHLTLISDAMTRREGVRKLGNRWVYLKTLPLWELIEDVYQCKFSAFETLSLPYFAYDQEDQRIEGLIKQLLKKDFRAKANAHCTQQLWNLQNASYRNQKSLLGRDIWLAFWYLLRLRACTVLPVYEIINYYCLGSLLWVLTDEEASLNRDMEKFAFSSKKAYFVPRFLLTSLARIWALKPPARKGGWKPVKK